MNSSTENIDTEDRCIYLRKPWAGHYTQSAFRRKLRNNMTDSDYMFAGDTDIDTEVATLIRDMEYQDCVNMLNETHAFMGGVNLAFVDNPEREIQQQEELVPPFLYAMQTMREYNDIVNYMVERFGSCPREPLDDLLLYNFEDYMKKNDFIQVQSGEDNDEWNTGTEWDIGARANQRKYMKNRYHHERRKVKNKMAAETKVKLAFISVLEERRRHQQHLTEKIKAEEKIKGLRKEVEDRYSQYEVDKLRHAEIFAKTQHEIKQKKHKLRSEKLEKQLEHQKKIDAYNANRALKWLDFIEEYRNEYIAESEDKDDVKSVSEEKTSKPCDSRVGVVDLDKTKIDPWEFQNGDDPVIIEKQEAPWLNGGFYYYRDNETGFLGKERKLHRWAKIYCTTFGVTFVSSMVMNGTIRKIVHAFEEDPHGFTRNVNWIVLSWREFIRGTGLPYVWRKLDHKTSIREKKTKEELTEMVVHAIEKICLLWANIQVASTYKSKGLILSLFLSCHLEGGLLINTSKYIEDIVNNWTDKGDEIIAEAGEEPKFMDNMKEQWSDLKGSKSSKKMFDLIGIAVVTLLTAGFGMKMTDFDIAKYLKMPRTSAKATSFAEFIVEDCLFFIEKGISFCKTGSFRDLFFDDVICKKYDVEYASIVGVFPNLQSGRIEEVTGQTLGVYKTRIVKCLENTKRFASQIEKHNERNFMVSRMAKLSSMLEDVMEVIRGKNSRIKPYGIELCGNSSVGKSNVKSMIIQLILKANPGFFSPEDPLICTMNGDDPYQSEYKNNHEVVVLDDLANSMPGFSTSNPCQTIINLLNNEPKAVIKADVESKGKVYYNANLVVVTTNNLYLNSNTLSVSPASIMRRFDAVITVTVAAPYRVDGGVGIDPDKVDSLYTDIWEFKVMKFVPTDKGQCAEHPMIFEGEEMTNVNFATLSKFLVYESRRHYKQQEQLLLDQSRVKNMTMCEHNNLDVMCPECKANEEIVAEHGIIDSYNDVCAVLPYIKQSWLLNKTEVFIIFLNSLFVSGVMLYMLKPKMCYAYLYLVFIISVCILKMYNKNKIIQVEPQFSLLKYSNELRKMKQAALLGVSVTTMVSIMLVLRNMLKAKEFLQKQGAFLSVDSFKEEPVKNCWIPEVKEPIKVCPKLYTMTTDQGIGLIDRKLAHARFSNKTFSGIFPLFGNVWVVNHHSMISNPEWVEVYVTKDEGLTLNFKAQIGSSSWRRIEGSDLCLIYLPSGGCQKDLTIMLPEEHTKIVGKATLVHKNKDGDIEHIIARAESMNAAFTKEEHGFELKGAGYRYTLDRKTFKGLCLSVLVSNGRDPFIMGFHCAGSQNRECEGYAQEITRSEVYRCWAEWISDPKSIVMNTNSEGTPSLIIPEHGIYLTGEVHPKCPSNYVKGSGKVYGSHTNLRSKMRSKVTETLICDDVAEAFNHPKNFDKPKNIGSYKPMYAELDKIANTREICPDSIQYALSDFLDKIFDPKTGLQDWQKETVGILPHIAVANGYDGIRGIDAINWNSSTGFPHCKTKRHYITTCEETHAGITNPVDIPKEFWDEMEKYEEMLKRGERIYPVNIAHLKDEPKKIGSEKVRVFYGTPFSFLLLMRKYTLSIAKLYMDNPDLFETTVGMNVFGPEWDDMIKKLIKRHIARIVGGDFASYDSKMAALMLLIAGKIIIAIAKWSGQYDADDIKILEGIFTELSNPLLDFFGTFIEVFGCNTSGHSLTIVINDIVHKIYMRSAYYEIYACNPPRPFHETVKLKTNGDDNISSVIPGEDLFNHSSVQDFFGKYGIEYTMPNKEDESVRYSYIEDIDYLKRRPRKEGDRFMPALDVESMFKMLQVCIPSKELSPEELSAININTCLQESYYHGKEVFKKFENGLMPIVHKHKLECWYEKGRPKTWEDCEAFDKDQIENGRQVPSQIEEVLIEQQNGSVDALKINNSDALWNSIKKESASIGYHTLEGLLSFESGGLLVADISSLREPLFRGVLSHKKDIYGSTHNSEADHEYKWITNTNTSKGFDDVTNNVSVEQMRDVHGTLTFRDGSEQWISAIPNIFDPTRDVGMSNDVPLADFFGRAVNIASYQWDPASIVKFYQTINPWDAFFSNSRVVNRINNFQLMRAKLKVKIVLNGNSFYYGRMMVDYGVRAIDDRVSIYGTGTTLNTLVSASQRNHIFLDPTESQGGILCLPYISDDNNMVVTEAGWINQGNLYFREMSKLKHANGSLNPITINVYAWAEDVMLSIPTKENCTNIIPQCGCIDDVDPNDAPRVAGFTEKIESQAGEYGTSAISNTLTAVAEAAGRLKEAPMIGPYARATQQVAGAAGSVARMFGFSRPNILDNPMVMKRNLLGKMTNTDQPDVCTKLTVDSKQELSIDPRIMGIKPIDEMNISYLASKESWFAQFPITVANRKNDLLFTTFVTPCVLNIVSPYYHATASAFACLPFTYWRGTVIYRFSIVASAYHRGRIMIVYAPNQQVGAPAEQVQYSKIVDLSDTRDFTMEIGWAQRRSFLQVAGITATNSWALTPLGTSGVNSNGTLSIFLLNDLTTPSDTVNNDITVNCFMKMGDDFAVAVPHERIKTFTYLNAIAPQCGTIEPQSGDMELDSEDNKPIREQVEECAAPCLELDHTFDVYFGEKISSFRQMLKRYTHFMSYYYSMTTGSSVTVNEFDFPLYRGYGGGGRHTTTTAPANIVNTTLLNYMAPAFVGYRGGIKYKKVVSNVGSTQGGKFIIARNNIATDYSVTNTVVNVANQSIFATNALSAPTLYEGGEVTDLNINPVLEVELPYYSPYRWTITRTIRDMGSTYYNRLMHTMNITAANGSSGVVVDSYVAAAEDFQLFLFQGMPPFQVTATIPVPTT